MRKFVFSILILLGSVSIAVSIPPKPITPETALQAYLHNSDKSFKWEVRNKQRLKTQACTVFYLHRSNGAE
jgi:hypothetical protein